MMPSPPNTLIALPSSLSLTEVTEGNWVAVKTTCARRFVMDSVPPPDSNCLFRSMVATLFEIETPSSVVPTGIIVLIPASASIGPGPESSSASGHRRTPTSPGGTSRSTGCIFSSTLK
jgi:hypothetical protein